MNNNVSDGVTATSVKNNRPLLTGLMVCSLEGGEITFRDPVVSTLCWLAASLALLTGNVVFCRSRRAVAESARPRGFTVSGFRALEKESEGARPPPTLSI